MQGSGMRGGGTQGSLCRPGPGPREPGSPRSETGYSPSGDGGPGNPRGAEAGAGRVSQWCLRAGSAKGSSLAPCAARLRPVKDWQTPRGVRRLREAGGWSAAGVLLWGSF